MTPTILVVGSTGNTGVGVVRTLAKDLPSSPFAEYRILALTRSVKGDTAQQFAKLDHVEVIERNWIGIDDEWLQEQNVKRIFIASHNGPTHFTDESLFLTYALRAGVEYVVRISTFEHTIYPSVPIYYPRAHWAIEQMLDTSDFEKLSWTSLRPNVFVSYIIPPLLEWTKKVKETGKQEPLIYTYDGDNLMAAIDPEEVGNAAAKLLLSKDTPSHNKKKYVLSGPTDVNGKQLVELIEKHIGAKVDEVSFADFAWMKSTLSSDDTPVNVVGSMKYTPGYWNRGLGSLENSPTSSEIKDIYEIKNGAKDVFKQALSQL